MTNAEVTFKSTVRRLFDLGTYPGPTAINRALGRSRKHMDQLNGRETEWRREIMKQIGIPLQRPNNIYMHETMYYGFDPYEEARANFNNSVL